MAARWVGETTNHPSEPGMTARRRSLQLKPDREMLAPVKCLLGRVDVVRRNHIVPAQEAFDLSGAPSQPKLVGGSGLKAQFGVCGLRPLAHDRAFCSGLVVGAGGAVAADSRAAPGDAFPEVDLLTADA